MIDMVPTFTTSNERICLLMTNGQMGSLRIEDAERLQACPFASAHTPAFCLHANSKQAKLNQPWLAFRASHDNLTFALKRYVLLSSR